MTTPVPSLAERAALLDERRAAAAAELAELERRVAEAERRRSEALVRVDFEADAAAAAEQRELFSVLPQAKAELERLDAAVHVVAEERRLAEHQAAHAAAVAERDGHAAGAAEVLGEVRAALNTAVGRYRVAVQVEQLANRAAREVAQLDASLSGSGHVDPHAGRTTTVSDWTEIHYQLAQVLRAGGEF